MICLVNSPKLGLDKWNKCSVIVTRKKLSKISSWNSTGLLCYTCNTRRKASITLSLPLDIPVFFFPVWRRLTRKALCKSDRTKKPSHLAHHELNCKSEKTILKLPFSCWTEWQSNVPKMGWISTYDYYTATCCDDQRSPRVWFCDLVHFL